MSNKPMEDLLREKIGGLADAIIVRTPTRIYLDVPPHHSVAANMIMFEQLGGRLATASGVDTRDRVEMLYHYCMDRRGIVVTIRTWAEKPDLLLDSVGQFLPAAVWIEREVQDLLGVKFVNHPDPRRLILGDDWPEGVYPLRRDSPARIKESEPIPGAEPARSTTP